MYRKLIPLLLFLMPLLLAAQDDGALSDAEIKSLLAVKIRTAETLAFSPTLIDAVRSQNAQNLTLDVIKERDEAWKSTDQLTPFKLSLQTSKAGKTLKRFVSENDDFNEAFLTDNQGANVAAYPATSDYWQGDEEKWTASFANGNGQTFVGPIERDESTQTVAVQISAPVMHRQETIGVLVVGVTLSYLESRQ